MTKKLAAGALLLLVASVLEGCATVAPAKTPVVPSGPNQVVAPTAIPTPLVGATVTLSGCCTATTPPGWSAAEVVNNGLEGTADASGKLNVSWQLLGAAKQCPSEPVALADTLTSPTHPSGVVITAVDTIQVDGRTAAVYVSSPSNTTEHKYQFFNADVVIGGRCVDVGGAEYGDASAANLETLLEIAASTRAFTLPPAPTSHN